MSKPARSQWDFGELFPPEQTRRVLSVSDLTLQIKRLLEKQVGSIWVAGEVTNLRAQSSGHIYFTLKDAGAQLGCVLFRNEAVVHRDFLADGQKVLLQGDVTVYEARGQYQLIVRAVEMQGIGALQIAFEKLKQKLAAEGLFAPERKRPLPAYPQRIGLVTSPTGAAIRDVLHVVQRRDPGLEIILAPCRVQGDGAAGEIARAIGLLNEFNSSGSRFEGELSKSPSDVQGWGEATDEPPRSSKFPAREYARPTGEAPSFHPTMDLILLTRGGGSLEDLWAFNEEIVARAIFESALPIVSAIGHEIDFTISDFVADIRAATPSAAAEIITEDVYASRQFVAEAPALMRSRMRKRLSRDREDLDVLSHRLSRVHPRRRLNELLQRLDDLQGSLSRNAKHGVRRRQVTWHHLAERLGRIRPAQLVKQRRELLKSTRRRLKEAARARLKEWQGRFSTTQARLQLLGPEQVLGRGYSITTDAGTGKVLRDAARVKAGQILKTRLKTGEIISKAQGGKSSSDSQ